MRIPFKKLIRITVRACLYLIVFIVLLAVGGSVYYMVTLFTPGLAHEGSLVLTGGTVLNGKDLEPHPNAAGRRKNNDLSFALNFNYLST